MSNFRAIFAAPKEIGDVQTEIEEVIEEVTHRRHLLEDNAILVGRSVTTRRESGLRKTEEEIVSKIQSDRNAERGALLATAVKQLNLRTRKWITADARTSDAALEADLVTAKRPTTIDDAIQKKVLRK